MEMNFRLVQFSNDASLPEKHYPLLEAMMDRIAPIPGFEGNLQERLEHQWQQKCNAWPDDGIYFGPTVHNVTAPLLDHFYAGLARLLEPGDEIHFRELGREWKFKSRGPESEPLFLAAYPVWYPLPEVMPDGIDGDLLEAEALESGLGREFRNQQARVQGIQIAMRSTESEREEKDLALAEGPAETIAAPESGGLSIAGLAHRDDTVVYISDEAVAGE